MPDEQLGGVVVLGLDDLDDRPSGQLADREREQGAVAVEASRLASGTGTQPLVFIMAWKKKGARRSR
jgi:hypothetical protein